MFAFMNPRNRPVILWLQFLCFAILVMIAIGGITRLTESGLSIVKWEPLMGALPPLNEAQWQERFAQYQAYPEYLVLKPDMTLAQFKGIFFWEYFHRLWGRSIGMFFLLPFVGFLITGHVRGALAGRLFTAFVLGGLQGALGWFMVKSGLVDLPRVSHFRLAAHLMLAMGLFAYLYWLVLDLKRGDRMPVPVSCGLRRFAWALLFLVSVQVAYGAFTAGLDAGYQFNTFPKMMGYWVPPGLVALDPAWLSFVSHPAAVQFVHRCLGWVLALSVTIFWWSSRKQGFRGAPDFLLGAVALQFVLGVLTLVLNVPITIAVAHQVNASLVLAALLAVLQGSASPCARA